LYCRDAFLFLRLTITFVTPFKSESVCFIVAAQDEQLIPSMGISMRVCAPFMLSGGVFLFVLSVHPTKIIINSMKIKEPYIAFISVSLLFCWFISCCCQ